MASLSDFFPQVMPFVHGCSYPLAEMHIREVCRDFCSFAPIVQETLEPLDALAGQREYDIDLEGDAETSFILRAWYQGQPLAILKTGDRNDSGYQAANGTPTGLQQMPGNRFLLDIAPAQHAPGAITMLVSTKPTTKARSVADVLLNDYAYEIGQGVVGRLLKIPGFLFSNPRDSGGYTATYLVARTDARIRAEASFGTASTRVRPRRFE